MTLLSTAQGLGLAITFFRNRFPHQIGNSHCDHHSQTAFSGLRYTCQDDGDGNPYQTAFTDRGKKTQGPSAIPDEFPCIACSICNSILLSIPQTSVCPSVTVCRQSTPSVRRSLPHSRLWLCYCIFARKAFALAAMSSLNTAEPATITLAPASSASATLSR